MTKRDLSDEDLDLLFEASRREVPEPSQAFLSTLEEQAVEVLQPTTPLRKRRRMRVSLMALVGGWVGLSGLATAAVAGVWIGAVAPGGLPDPVGLVSVAIGETAADYDGWFGANDTDWLLAEDETDG